MKTMKIGLALLASAFVVSTAFAGGQKLKTGAPGATAPKKGEKVAVIDTNYGRIIFKFFPKLAPIHVANFEKLAGKHFYDDVTFHRAVVGFMIQGGDPDTKGQGAELPGGGGPGYTIKDEPGKLSHKRGIVSQAMTNQPNSGGSQFFIMVGDAPHLDRMGFSAFGQVVQGMDVVDKIVALPKHGDQMDLLGKRAVVMKKVRVMTWPVK